MINDGINYARALGAAEASLIYLRIAAKTARNLEALKIEVAAEIERVTAAIREILPDHTLPLTYAHKTKGD